VLDRPNEPLGRAAGGGVMVAVLQITRALAMAQPHDASVVTPAEYLAFERNSGRKHEYLAGRNLRQGRGEP